MIRATLLIGLALAASACEPRTTLTFQGDDIYKNFPFNGSRVWTYQSTDTSLPYRLVATLSDESELLEDGRTRAYTVDFDIDCVSSGTDCVEERAFSWVMSADSSKGTLFHAYNDQVFDPPVRLSSAQMQLDATVDTESGGVAYTSTYTDRVACPAPYWRGEVPDCVQMDLAGTGSPLAGTYWAVFQFNIVAFTLTERGETWQMVDHSFDD